MTNQGYLQAKAVQEGLFEVIPEYMLKFLTPSDLEKKICGEQEFDLELLKNITVYEGYKSSDITIKYFWQFLEECSLEDKFNYIKFVLRGDLIWKECNVITVDMFTIKMKAIQKTT